MRDSARAMLAIVAFSVSSKQNTAGRCRSSGSVEQKTHELLVVERLAREVDRKGDRLAGQKFGLGFEHLDSLVDHQRSISGHELVAIGADRKRSGPMVRPSSSSIRNSSSK